MQCGDAVRKERLEFPRLGGEWVREAVPVGVHVDIARNDEPALGVDDGRAVRDDVVLDAHNRRDLAAAGDQNRIVEHVLLEIARSHGKERRIGEDEEVSVRKRLLVVGAEGILSVRFEAADVGRVLHDDLGELE